jgi:uncharacterized protein (DUF305 family)
VCDGVPPEGGSRTDGAMPRHGALTTEIYLKETSMNLKKPNPLKALLLVPLAALWLASATAHAQTAPTMAPSASMPMGQMKKGAAGPHDMKASMMMGMEGMQKMPMSGDTDKDFAMMMKLHHQQALNMAEMELANGKSTEMKAMAKQIIVAQKKEIAQFDKWLAKQK